MYEVHDQLGGGVQARAERNARTRAAYAETLAAAAGGAVEARDMSLPAGHAHHRVLVPPPPPPPSYSSPLPLTLLYCGEW